MNKYSNQIIWRVSEEFAKLLDESKRTRVIIGKDDPKKIKAEWSIILAYVRHPLNKKIKDDIINAELT